MSDLGQKLSRALAEGHKLELSRLESDARFTKHDTPAAAAVLIAVTQRPEPTVILTQRPQAMRSHPGQVAFPGGKIDPGEDAIAAALREADEELALPPAQVQVIGATDRYQTGTGFDITPVLATVPPDLPLTPNPDEVEAWFEAPLDLLLSRAPWEKHEGVWDGKTRHYYSMHYDGFRIWGVTAGIIANLAARIGPHLTGELALDA